MMTDHPATVPVKAAVTAKIRFVLKTFDQVDGSRVFSFEGVASDRSRSAFTVEADLALARTYGIRLQELPLLCREFLEESYDGGERREFTYSEPDMRAHSDAAAARAEAARAKRPPPRKPAAGTQLGSAWRGPVR